MKEKYDKRAKELNFQIGDKVLLDIKVIPKEENKKLAAKYEGPYRIWSIIMRPPSLKEIMATKNSYIEVA